MDGVVLRAIALTRAFDRRVAVSDLSFELRRGESLVLLGPNGAGKTTTLRMLAGLIMPSSGAIEIEGVALSPETADTLRRHIGLLTETPGLWDRLSVERNLLTYARLYNLDHPADAVERALDMVAVSDRARDAAGTLSKGLRQRVAIARALIHNPPILLLDEPTAGLDPSSARQMRNLIDTLRREGRAVIVSTHNLTEAEALADRIAILNTRLVALDAPAALRQQLRGARVEIEIEGPAGGWAPIAAPFAAGAVDASGSLLVLTVAAPGAIPDLVAALVAGGARIVRVTPDRRTLEEAYLSLVGAPEDAA